jgi:small-conductance mechanosensitive channel
VTDVWHESWFWPAVTVVVALPVVLVVLTELLASLERREHPAAKVVRVLRNYVVPAGALLILVSQVQASSDDFTWTRVVATVFGFLLIVVLLNGLNVALFTTARRGTWQQRVPSIFVDLARLLLIAISLAILFSWVWGADVGGLFTALGVTSVVLGLALQSAVGPIVAGLFLLFEQPFQIGDWLDVGGTRGRVVEVNWRAVHLDTGNGVQIIPNGTLAGASFTNLSRTSGPFAVETDLTFATDDAPHEVLALVLGVARDLREVSAGEKPSARPLGGAQYRVSIPVTGPGLEDAVLATFLTRLWYAARRADLHLDGDLTDDYATPERLLRSLRAAAPSLQLDADEIDEFVQHTRLERFGAGEWLQRDGAVPTSIGVIVDGEARLTAPVQEGNVPVATLGVNDFIGLTALTREPLLTSVLAVTDVTVVVMSVETLDALVRRKPALARDIGRSIDNRRSLASAAARQVTDRRDAGRVTSA